jgi:hypothetical protein
LPHRSGTPRSAGSSTVPSRMVTSASSTSGVPRADAAAPARWVQRCALEGLVHRVFDPWTAIPTRSSLSRSTVATAARLSRSLPVANSSAVKTDIATPRRSAWRCAVVSRSRSPAKTSTGWPYIGRYTVPQASADSSPITSGCVPAMPLTRKAVTFSRRQVCRSSRSRPRSETVISTRSATQRPAMRGAFSLGSVENVGGRSPANLTPRKASGRSVGPTQ